MKVKDSKYQDTTCRGREKYMKILKENILNNASNHSNNSSNATNSKTDINDDLARLQVTLSCLH